MPSLKGWPATADPEVHGHLHCTSRKRFRCAICWRAVCWCKGCADAVERELAALLDSRLFLEMQPYKTDVGRRVLLPIVTDVGICDDCWCALGGEAIRVDYVDD